MSRIVRSIQLVALWFERTVAIALVATLMAVLIWSCFIFVGTIARELWRVGAGHAPRVEIHTLLSRMDLLREVFGGFLLLLIGLELMKTVVMYLDEHVLHWEVVFPVALIAVARHTLEVDLVHTPPLAMLGIGVVIVTLAAAYLMLRRSTLDFLYGPGRPKEPSSR